MGRTIYVIGWFMICVAIMDMGYGHMFAEFECLNINSKLLWDLGTIMDIFIGFIAGTAGAYIFFRKLQHIIKT